MRRTDATIVTLTAANDDVIDRAALAAGGVRRRVIATKRKRGALNTLHAGVFIVGNAAPEWRQLVRAALLAAGAFAVASHRTAARLYGLDVEFDGIEITTPFKKHPVPNGVHVYRSRRPLTRTRCLDGIRVASVERVLIDLAAVLGREALERAVESALLQRLTTEDRIYAALVIEGGRGVRGVKDLVRVLETRPLGRPARSVLEIKVGTILRRARITHGVRNYRVIGADGRNYEIDRAFPDEMLAIEADSARFHSTRTQVDNDKRKQAALEALGWRFKRVTWDDAYRTPDEVIADIKALLTCKSVEPRSPHR